MRQFSADYLADTRRGMWAGDRSALRALSLPDRERVVDVGAGTGEFTAVLREETPAPVVACDADPDLLAEAGPPALAGDAERLPFRDDAADLVTCQALLVNLPDPAVAVREFAHVSSDLVAAVEPDNAAVAVESTVGGEAALAASAREAYAAGVPSDVTLGADAADVFGDAGLTVEAQATYYHTRVVEPPYSERALTGAKLKARGTRISEARATLRAGGMSASEIDALEADWKAMGRSAIEQIQRGEYRRSEVVPFYVTVGRV
ncbi:MAG: class I SAM-dependent methyltransferase [Halobacteriaceae archaeon]